MQCPIFVALIEPDPLIGRFAEWIKLSILLQAVSHFVTEIGAGGGLPAGYGYVITKAVGWRGLLVAGGKNLSNDVSSGGESAETVDAGKVSGGFWIAGLENAGVVQIDVKNDSADTQFTGILNAIAVGIVENGAGDGS